jgi:hypothetical protein
MDTGWILDVYWMYTGCILDVYWMDVSNAKAIAISRKGKK